MKFAYSVIAGLVAAASATPAHILAPRAGTSGCGKSHASGFTDYEDNPKIATNGTERQFAIRVPDEYNSNTNLPRKVIVDFHGHNAFPINQYNNSRYDNFTDGKPYLVVYPKGLEEAWQGAPYAYKNETRNNQTVNDIQFVQDLLKYVRNNYCVDVNHVYASGKSNGGGFVDTLACSAGGDEFAAFAMAAAALYTDNSRDNCTKKRAILEAHGQKDTVIEYGGGSRKDGGTYPPIADWVSWWGYRDGCRSSGNTTSETGYDTTTYTCNGFTNVTMHYHLLTTGHCWPTKRANYDSRLKSECPDAAIEYTPKVLDFFSKWDLTKAAKLSSS